MSESSKVSAVTDASFQKDVIEASRPALVDFWASWCAPCRAIAPVVDELAETYGDKVKFLKMNIDENSSTPTKLGIRGVPTLMLFRDGRVVDQVVGAVPREHLERLVKKGL